MTAPLADEIAAIRRCPVWTPRGRGPGVDVAALVTDAALDLAPAESDVDGQRGADAREDLVAVCRWGDGSAPEHWQRERAEPAVTRECGCGCGGIYCHCDDCGRLVTDALAFGCPSTTSLYWLCDGCRARWEREGKCDD